MFYGSTPPCSTDERHLGMIFDQNRDPNAPAATSTAVRRQNGCPAKTSRELTRASPKPFATLYSDRLLDGHVGPDRTAEDPSPRSAGRRRLPCRRGRWCYR